MMPEELGFDEFARRYCERQVNTPEGLKAILMEQQERYRPDGWMLLECQQFDSSWFGSYTIVPYGPNNTLKTVPDHPLSPRGLASDMSVVSAVLKANCL